MMMMMCWNMGWVFGCVCLCVCVLLCNAAGFKTTYRHAFYAKWFEPICSHGALSVTLSLSFSLPFSPSYKMCQMFDGRLPLHGCETHYPNNIVVNLLAEFINIVSAYKFSRFTPLNAHFFVRRWYNPHQLVQYRRCVRVAARGIGCNIVCVCFKCTPNCTQTAPTMRGAR